MPQLKKNTTYLRKTRNRKKLSDREIVLLTKNKEATNGTLFPDKLKKINKLLENATLNPGK